MDNEIKCPFCGVVGISKKKRVLGQRTDSKFYFIHHESESRHNSYSNDPSHPLRLLQCICS